MVKVDWLALRNAFEDLKGHETFGNLHLEDVQFLLKELKFQFTVHQEYPGESFMSFSDPAMESFFILRYMNHVKTTGS
jgi:hypothetical protein